MAADALCRGSLELAAYVALRALDGSVCAGQCEAREGRVIKLRSLPRHSGVALLASCRES